MSLRDEPTIEQLIAERLRSLDRVNSVYDSICGPVEPTPPPSLEAVEGFVKRHRDRHSLSSETYCRLDAALENIEDVRRSQR